MRLHWRIFLSMVGVLAAALLLTGLATLLFHDGPDGHLIADRLAAEGRWIETQLQPANEPGLEQRLSEAARALDLRAALFDDRGTLLASSHPDPPAPDLGRAQPSFLWRHRDHGAFQVPLSGGGRLVLWQLRHQVGPPPAFWFGLMVFFALLMIGAYPIAHQITRRLETLRQGVRRLGEGELDSRVQVRGRDELAELAESFNWAADRIEQLVGAQRRMLASASHELRSPLARLRLALVLLPDAAPERAAELLHDSSTDIEELDELIGDLLLSSRLQALPEVQKLDEVDLAALVKEEAARFDARWSGDAATLRGDRRMLQRLLRNLLENARRHGGEGEIDVMLKRSDGNLLLSICDSGPGVPVADQERIFEPFFRPAGHREGQDGGVGLGLALVQQIAHSHGGEVCYRPRQGGGSCFEIRLPAEPARAVGN